MKNILIIIIILLILVAGYFLFFYNPSTSEEISDSFENFDIQIRDMSDIPEEYFSGNSRFSNGECQQDADCFEQGCNLEMCTSDKNIMTTCEIGGDFPDKTKYACGCIKDVCGWYSLPAVAPH